MHEQRVSGKEKANEKVGGVTLKQIKNSNYFIDQDGNVYRKLRPNLSKGYYKISLGSKIRNQRIHQLVAEAFIGARPDGMVINHKDGNKINNNKDNLEYCTNWENHQHALKTGLTVLEHNRKLSDGHIKEIKKRLSTGERARKIASEFGVHEVTIGCIKNNKTWRNV